MSIVTDVTRQYVRSRSRESLLAALSGTDADRIRYAIERTLQREMMALWVWGNFVNDPARHRAAAHHALHQASRLHRLAYLRGTGRP